MPFTIDTFTYNKAARYPQRHGYQLRGTNPTSIIVHSTSNRRRNTAFASEAKFLFESPDVSAHFLVGKSGQIVQFLDPHRFQAWHAGEALSAYSNMRSIGIELHHSVGDPPYPQAQLDALAWLVRRLMEQFAIPVERVDTHGQVALPGPYDRKKDPGGWSHPDFLAWRARLKDAEPPPSPPRFVVTHDCPVFESRIPDTIALDGTAELHVGDEVLVDEVKDGFAHIARASPIFGDVGFAPVGALDRV